MALIWLLPAKIASPRSGTSGLRRELWAFMPHEGAAVRGLALSPDGALLATGGQDGGVKLWNARQGGLVRTLAGHAMAVRDVAFGLRCQDQGGSGCTPILATGGEDRIVQVWDATTGALIPPVFDQNMTVTGVSISPDGARRRHLRLQTATSASGRSAPPPRR